ncbi:hypothetical protein ACTFIZ_001044 [Dictyostelium cf. discoideum]
MASPDQDPYYLAEQDIASSVRGIMTTHEKWKQLLFNTNTYTNKEFKWYNKEIRKVLAVIEEDIGDILEAIGTIEKFPGRYVLAPGELDRRKLFANDVKIKINEIKEDLQSPRALAKIEEDKQNELLSSEKRNMIERGGKFEGLRRAHDEDNRDFLREQAGYQRELMNRQDEGLDQMKDDVQILGEMGKAMHSELKIQEGLLDSLHDRAAKSSETLGSVMRKLDRFMESTSSKLQWTIIAILGIIFVGLVVLTTMIKK